MEHCEKCNGNLRYIQLVATDKDGYILMFQCSKCMRISLIKNTEPFAIVKSHGLIDKQIDIV